MHMYRECIPFFESYRLPFYKSYQRGQESSDLHIFQNRIVCLTPLHFTYSCLQLFTYFHV